MKDNGGGSIISIGSNEQIPSLSYAYNMAKKARTEALLALVNKWWEYIMVAISLLLDLLITLRATWKYQTKQN